MYKAMGIILGAGVALAYGYLVSVAPTKTRRKHKTEQNTTRKFLDACKLGHLDTLKRVVSTETKFLLSIKWRHPISCDMERLSASSLSILDEAIVDACENDHMNVMTWLIVYFRYTIEDFKCEKTKDPRLTYRDLLAIACRNGNLVMAQWLANYFKLTTEDVYDMGSIFYWVCDDDRLDIARWLTAYFKPDSAVIRCGSNQALRVLCINGNIVFIKWLVVAYKLTAKDARATDDQALRYACADKCRNVVEWLIDFCEYTENDLRNIVAYKYRDDAKSCEPILQKMCKYNKLEWRPHNHSEYTRPYRDAMRALVLLAKTTSM